MMPISSTANEKHNKPFVFKTTGKSPALITNKHFIGKPVSIEKENTVDFHFKVMTDTMNSPSSQCCSRMVSPIRKINFGISSIKKFDPRITPSPARKEDENITFQFKARPKPSFEIPLVIYNSTKLTKFKEFSLITNMNKRSDKKQVYEQQMIQRQCEIKRNQSPEDRIKEAVKDKEKSKGIFSHLLRKLL